MPAPGAESLVTVAARMVAVVTPALPGGAIRGRTDPAGPCSGNLAMPLAAPAGHELAFEPSAEGVQFYVGGRAAGANAWTFLAPATKLTASRGQPAGKHLAGRYGEGVDGREVVGARMVSARADPAAIPWLLLRAATVGGVGRMADVTFVQRLPAWGGMAPKGGCEMSKVGAVVRVRYPAACCYHRCVSRP